MPLVAFSTMPDDARVWVFGSEASLPADTAATTLATIDEYLSGWSAHGSPLTVARDWRDDRFLAIAVDQRAENASGCSLDALFRVLRGLEERIGSALLGSSRVYYRRTDGSIGFTDRAGFASLAEHGEIRQDTPVFDLSVQTAGAWRKRFELPVSATWHNALLPAAT